MKILDFIFNNISLRTYTISATIIFTALFYFTTIFLIKFYSSESENNQYSGSNGIHIIIKIFVLFFSLLAGFFAQGIVSELYIFRDWECSMRGNCL